MFHPFAIRISSTCNYHLAFLSYVCLFFRASQEGDVWGCYRRWDSSNGYCWSCGLCEDTTWPSLIEHCVGSASEWGGEAEILQELVQVQEEGFLKIFEAIWIWRRKEEYPITAGENEKIRHCYSGFGSHSGMYISYIKFVSQFTCFKLTFTLNIFFYVMVPEIHNLILCCNMWLEPKMLSKYYDFFGENHIFGAGLWGPSTKIWELSNIFQSSK